jgi:hypothetical protein
VYTQTYGESPAFSFVLLLPASTEHQNRSTSDNVIVSSMCLFTPLEFHFTKSDTFFFKIPEVGCASALRVAY